MGEGRAVWGTAGCTLQGSDKTAQPFLRSSCSWSWGRLCSLLLSTVCSTRCTAVACKHPVRGICVSGSSLQAAHRTAAWPSWPILLCCSLVLFLTCTCGIVLLLQCLVRHGSTNDDDMLMRCLQYICLPAAGFGPQPSVCCVRTLHDRWTVLVLDFELCSTRAITVVGGL